VAHHAPFLEDSQMEEEIPELPPEFNDVLDLGMRLGNNQAFGLIAGRCSAAQASGLKSLREDEKYKTITPRWRDFCSRYLHISGAEADRIIQLWNEFGAGYFEMSHLTRVSPDIYRAIAPSIRGGALHTSGEVIELNVENSRRLAAAVAEVRQRIRLPKPAPTLEPHERIAEIEKRTAVLIAEFEHIVSRERDGENWLWVVAIVSRAAAAFGRMELASGLK
jgi:hypothetical protein